MTASQATTSNFILPLTITVHLHNFQAAYFTEYCHLYTVFSIVGKAGRRGKDFYKFRRGDVCKPISFNTFVLLLVNVSFISIASNTPNSFYFSVSRHSVYEIFDIQF